MASPASHHRTEVTPVSETPQHPELRSELRETLAARTTRRRRGLFAALSAFVVVGVAIGSYGLGVSVGSHSAAADDRPARLHLRLAVSEDSSYQDAIREVAAEKGLDVEWVNVDDWVLPNTELVAGNVDGNAFQHSRFLSVFNVEQHADITPVFSTTITQWGIFSATIDDLGELGEGDRIGIPDDPANIGRALHILESAGLLTLAADAGDFPTTDDVVTNPHQVAFVELPATTIPQQFDDPSLTAVVVGTSYFEPSQGVSKDDALFLDDPSAASNLPYVNMVATTPARLSDPAWEVLEQVYADPRVTAALDEESFGNTLPVQVPVATLRDTLATLEASVAAEGDER